MKRLTCVRRIASCAGLAMVFASVTYGPAVSQTLRFGTYANTSVRFATADSLLQGIYDAAEAKQATLVRTDGAYRVLVEGGGYNNVWIETQPMGGEMYVKRNMEVALNNQLIFIDYQRADGLLPFYGGTNPGFSRLQGYCFPLHAWKMYFHIGKNRDYLDTLYQAFRRHDEWLWANRDTDHDGVLEGTSPDMGTDGATAVYADVHEPMDITAYSFDGRNILARIAAELGNGQETVWRARADSLKATVRRLMWDSTLHACYNLDVSNRRTSTLVHNNLRCMYHGIFSQQMADEFISHHLFNRSEFWTPMPLVSVAINDPRFFYSLSDRNNWSGASQGLTFQRILIALDNYGHYAEQWLVGDRLLRSLNWNCHFTQQFDPITTLPYADNYYDYGPSQLAALEYITYLYGVRRDEDSLFWSGLARGSHTQEYTQVWGANEYRIRTDAGIVRGYIGATEVFNSTPGVRVVTDLAGNVARVIGLDTVSSRNVTLNAGGSSYSFTVHPNEVLERSGPAFVSVKQVPYGYDPRVQVGRPWGPVLADYWSSKAIRVHWMDRFSDQTGFAVERADDSTFTRNIASFTAAAADSCFIDNTVTAGQKYYYRVRVQGSQGQSGYSYVTSATAQDPYLSDLDFFVLRAGRSYYRDRSESGSAISLGGVTFSKGIATHANCRVIYDLGGLYSRFTAQVGVDDAAGSNGSVTFSVYLDSDSSAAFASGLMRGGEQRKTVDIDLSGKRKMMLVVTDGGDGIGWDHAEWADARLTGADMPTRIAASAAEPATTVPRPRIAVSEGVLAVTNLGRAEWTVRIVDPAGRMVAVRHVRDVESISVGTRGLAAGAYVVRLDGPYTISVRLIVTGR